MTYAQNPPNPLGESPIAAKPHAGGVEKALAWLKDRHRKGWMIAFTRLSTELLSPEDLKKLGQLDEETLGMIDINLTEWLLSEGEIQVQGSMRRICDYLVGPIGPNWNAGQREWLQQLGQRPLRLYDVTDVVPGVGMTLCDSLSPEIAPVVVQDRAASRGLAPGKVLGCRVMRVGDHFELSGAGYSFTALTAPDVRARLLATADEFGHLPGLAHEQGLVLMAAWLQQFVAPPMPVLIDQHSGDPMCLITDHYSVLDWDALAHAMQDCADVEGDRSAGWSRIMTCEDGQIRPLVRINLGKKADQIELFYKTQRYADTGRVWFDALTAGQVTFLTREVMTTAAMMHRASQPPARSGSSVSPANLNSPKLTQAMTDMIRRSYANWADEPLPALNHKTPRQAIKSAAGLERVKNLLRSYASREKADAVQQGRAEISYDFLWDALGLPH